MLSVLEGQEYRVVALRPERKGKGKEGIPIRNGDGARSGWP